jgi:hypothetical protein
MRGVEEECLKILWQAQIHRGPSTAVAFATSAQDDEV